MRRAAACARRPSSNRRKRRPPAELGARLRVGQRQPQRDHAAPCTARRAAAATMVPRTAAARRPHSATARDNLAEAHRLVVHDVVGAAGGRLVERRDRRARRVVDVDARQQAAIAADRRQHAALRHRDHVDGRRRLGSVEQTVAQHDAFDRAGPVRLEDLRFHRAHRLGGGTHIFGDRRGRSANQCERAADQALRAGRDRRRDQVAGAVDAQAVGRDQVASALRSAFRQRGQLVHDVGRTRSDDDAAQGVGVERVNEGRRRTERLQQRSVRRGTG